MLRSQAGGSERRHDGRIISYVMLVRRTDSQAQPKAERCEKVVQKMPPVLVPPHHAMRWPHGMMQELIGASMQIVHSVLAPPAPPASRRPAEAGFALCCGTAASRPGPCAYTFDRTGSE